MAPTPANIYADVLRHDLCAFIHRSFLELNPREEFLFNWHIERLAAKLEEVRRGSCKRLIWGRDCLRPPLIPCDIHRSFQPGWIGCGTGARGSSLRYVCEGLLRQPGPKVAVTRRRARSDQALFSHSTFKRARGCLAFLSNNERRKSRLSTCAGGVWTARGADIRAPRTMPVSTRDWLSVQMMAVFERDFPPGWLPFVHLTPLS